MRCVPCRLFFGDAGSMRVVSGQSFMLVEGSTCGSMYVSVIIC